jgi:hypothetical protein
MRPSGATLLKLLALAAPFAAGVELGCGSEPTLPGDAGPEAEAGAWCPGTLADMHAEDCSIEGLECPVGFPCEVATELVRCTCRGSRWACADPLGPIDAGDAPRCVDPASPPTEPCPASMEIGEGDACAEIGRACFYRGQLCADGVTMLDYCDCGRDADGALVYSCVEVPCPPA